MLVIFTWLATLFVLLTYGFLVKGWVDPWVFDAANFAAAWPLVFASVLAGVFAQAALSCAFGCIGLYGLVRRGRIRRLAT